MKFTGKLWLSLLLAAALLLAMTGCSKLQQVVDTVQQISDTVETISDAISSLSPDGTQASGNGEASNSGAAGSLLQGLLSGGGNTGTGAGGEGPQTQYGDEEEDEEGGYAGELSGYFDSLREEWKAEKNEGYVWTITIDDDAHLDELGLVQADYHLSLSCSHVGQDLGGIYCGSMSMTFDADISGVNDLLGAMGGQITSSDMSGLFVNDAFAMELAGDGNGSELFVEMLNKPYEEQMASDPSAAIAASMLEDMDIESQPFETSSYPVGWWFDWDTRMTDGDMSTYASMSGNLMGVSYGGSGGTDVTGSHLEASGVASSPLAGVFHERESKDYDMPFPYVLKVYNTGEVLLTLYSSSGGPVVIKFYGTIDKIPVSQTTVVK